LKHPKKPNHTQVVDILARFREASTEREKRKVANSIRGDFPDISKKLTQLINEGGSRGGVRL